MSRLPPSPCRGPLAALAAGLLVVVWGCWSAEDAFLQPPANGAGQSSLALIVSGDTAGFITPCGCASDQAGGLLRRASYAGQVGQSAEAVLVDVGGAPGGTSEYEQAKFEAILTGGLTMGLVAQNLGTAEAALGPAVLRDLGQRLGVPWLSTNLQPPDGQPLGESAILVERAGRRLLLLGVLDPRRAPTGWQATDPSQAVQQALAERRDPPVDWVVVLAYLDQAELLALAESLPEVDVIVGGPTGQSLTPRLVGRTLVAAATNKGKYLAHLDPPAEPRQPWTGHIVELGPDLEDDPRQQANLEAFRQRLEQADFRADQTDFVTAHPASWPEGYRIAGEQSCRDCHGADCASWEASAHAHAWETLVTQGAHVDSYCQQCHTTGYGLPGGFQSVGRSLALVNVSCESCHGPSSAHAATPRVPTTYMGRAKERCVTCHDPENSPEFDYDTYWPQVEHGQPATPPGAGPQAEP